MDGVVGRVLPVLGHARGASCDGCVSANDARFPLNPGSYRASRLVSVMQFPQFLGNQTLSLVDQAAA